MKTLFLRGVKITESTKATDNTINNEVSQSNEAADMWSDWYDDYDTVNESVSVQTDIEENGESNDITGFNFSDYDNSKKKIFKNTDGFKPYSFDYEYLVTHKQARTMIEEKRPFIVSKLGTKRNVVEDTDNIYHTVPKMKIEDKSIQRLGFVLADEKVTKFRLKDKKKKRYKGVINDEYLILKKKPFNTKKIGYIKLQESTRQKDLYVEVITNRGYKWLAALLLILGLTGLYINTKDWEGWHINLDKLRIYKTEEITEYKESELVISLNGTPVLKNGFININLSSEYTENITYVALLYDENNNLIYESDEINAGEGISKIEETELKGIMTTGEHECILICESYRNNNYIGSVESDLVLNVKEDK